MHIQTLFKAQLYDFNIFLGFLDINISFACLLMLLTDLICYWIKYCNQADILMILFVIYI